MLAFIYQTARPHIQRMVGCGTRQLLSLAAIKPLFSCRPSAAPHYNKRAAPAPKILSLYSPVVTICTAQWSLYVPPVVTICTAQWSLYVPHSGHYMYRTVVTICTAQWSLYVPHSGHYMYRIVVIICTAQWSLYVLPV